MLITPQKGVVETIDNFGTVGAASPGTGIPGHATVANNYGTLTEVISAASNTQDSWGISIAINNCGLSATICEASMDIYIGGATDDLFIKSLLCGYTPNATGWTQYFFPVHIPGGVRLAAQLASVRTGITARLLMRLYSGGVPPFRVGRKVTTYGTKINNSRGQAITVTASGGAATATELSASSSEDHFCFAPGFQVENDLSITPTGCVNIGVGVGSATEQRIGTWFFAKETAEIMNGPIPPSPAFADVPSGTRLTMLASNSGTNDAAYGGHIYAVS